MALKKERDWVCLGMGCKDARDLTFTVPDTVQICPLCHGNGKRRQGYTDGHMTGSCDFCKTTGFVYKETARGVPESVLNQIAVASNLQYRHFYAYGIDWRTEE